MKNKLLYTSLLFLVVTTLTAQDLKTTIEEVLSTNPTVLERLKNYNATKEDITSAKAGYYPKLDLSIGVGYEHTVKNNGNNDGTFDFAVYQNSLKYTQNLFQGFKTMHQVEQQESKTTSSAYSYIEKVNDTAFETVNAYLQVMRNKELLENAQANVDINKEIFEKVQKLYDAGLTTLSEVNKIESSLSLAKANYIVQENTLLDVTYSLHRVVGRYLNIDEMVKPRLNIALPENIEEAALIAMKNNPSLLVSANNIKIAQAAYKESDSLYYPNIDIEISQSMNNNLSAIEGEDNRFRAMAYLTYNFFNGFADSAAKQKSISNIHKEVEVKNKLRRETIEGLNLSWAANEKLNIQLDHLSKYKEFAFKTLTLYAKEYDLGRRSLLDLLSAQNDFIGAKAQLINTEYNMLFAQYRILDAMGSLVSVLVEDTNLIYANVGLNAQAPQNNDTLPILFDKDRDLVVDEYDICNNSISDTMRNTFGCAYVYEDTKRIERYTGFLYQQDDSNLSESGHARLNDLITQIEGYGWENLKFDVLSNVDSEDMSEDDIYTLSKQRAQFVKDKLVEAGAIKENITIHAQANKAPMYSNESSDSITLNNRADIIVRKLIK